MGRINMKKCFLIYQIENEDTSIFLSFSSLNPPRTIKKVAAPGGGKPGISATTRGLIRNPDSSDQNGEFNP